MLVVALAGEVLGGGGSWATALVLPLLVPIVNTAAGLYRRDELVLASSTLDEAPAVFQAATLCAVLTFLVSSLTLSSPLGGRYVAVTMIGLTALTLLLRGVARSGARRLTPPERCLVVGQLDTRAAPRRPAADLAGGQGRARRQLPARRLRRLLGPRRPHRACRGGPGLARRARDHRRRRRARGARPRDDPDRQVARRQGQPAAGDVRRRRLVRRLRLPRRADAARRAPDRPLAPRAGGQAGARLRGLGRASCSCSRRCWR